MRRFSSLLYHISQHVNQRLTQRALACQDACVPLARVFVRQLPHKVGYVPWHFNRVFTPENNSPRSAPAPWGSRQAGPEPVKSGPGLPRRYLQAERNRAHRKRGVYGQVEGGGCYVALRREPYVLPKITSTSGRRCGISEVCHACRRDSEAMFTRGIKFWEWVY